MELFKKRNKKRKKKFDTMRFSKKIIIFTMGCTITYAVVYLILCFHIMQLPDYSFNAGIFAALTAENWCNAWIKVKTGVSSNEDSIIAPSSENDGECNLSTRGG